MNKPTCYLSGPMRGIPKLNFPTFNRLAAKLRRAGWHVINPAELDQQAGMSEDSPQEFDFYQLLTVVKRDVRQIETLDPSRGDAIIVMEDWIKHGRQSGGTFAELALGAWMGLPILLLEEQGNKFTLTKMMRNRSVPVWEKQ